MNLEAVVGCGYQDEDGGVIAASPRDTLANLAFITPQLHKPVLLSAAYTGGEPRELFAVEEHRVLIRDMRPIANSLTLDRHGMGLRYWPTDVDDLTDERLVDGVYVSEVEDFLAAEFNASVVVVFDVTRRSDRPEGAQNKDGFRGPASRVHVDYTWASGSTRARDVLGPGVFAAYERAGRRVIQVNVWRPVRGPVRRSPLALADASSIDPMLLLATDQIFPDRRGEIYHLAFSEYQRWFYAPELNRDEVLLIKGWDSLEEGVARFTPHAAFKLPDHDDVAEYRESVEARAFVVV
jgi:hypothetical protein